MKTWQAPLVILSAYLCFIGTGAAAPLRMQDVPVMQRQQPGFDPVGGRIGNLMLYPTVELMENFDSNIYALKTAPKTDFITRVQPGLKLHSLNTERGFDADMSVEQGYYKNHSKENYTDFAARFMPYWLLTRTMTLKADLSHQKRHELRSDPDASANNATVEPVRYQRTAAKLTWGYKRGRIGLELSGERAYLDFDNGKTSAGQSVINDDRNRFENAVSAELSCDLTDRSAIYWASEWFNRDYKRPDFDLTAYTGPKRNSDGVQSVVGLRWPLTHVIALDGNIGYRSQSFDDPAYRDIGRAVGKAAVTWIVTPLTTIDVTAYRNVFETNQAGASGYVQSDARATLSHELRRNVIVQLSGGFGANDYIGLKRKDDYAGAGTAAIYKMNRFLHWRLAYDFDRRDSNVPAAVYDKHRIFLSAKMQF